MTLPSPKHYWKFDETGGLTAADAAGGAMMALDREAWVPGRMGNAVRFDPGDGVRLATTTLPELPPPWSAAVWVKREADSDGAALWSSNDCALKLEQWPGTHQVGVTVFGKVDASFEGAVLQRDTWTHLALVGTASETRLYLNGEPRGTVSMSIHLGMQWLGSTQGYVEHASALLDEVKVFDQALTDAQIGELAAWTPGIATIFPLSGRWNGGRPVTIAVSGNALTVDMSPMGRPNATGTILAPDQIQMTFPDDRHGAYTGRLIPNPDRIQWGPGNAWPRA